MPTQLIKKKLVNPKITNKQILTIFSSLPENRQKEVLAIWARCNFYEIVYISDGLKIKGFIVEPKKLKSLTPVIIYNRGGSKDFGMIDERVLYFRLSEYAGWGYIVFASQLRGSKGSEGKDEFGGKDIDDILSLKVIIDEQKHADQNNIAMIGGSRGGMMTYKALTMASWIKVAVVEAGTTDVEGSYKRRPQLKAFRSDMYNVNSKEENKNRSAIYFANKISKNVPILIFHGTKDKSVSPSDSLRLCEKLQKNGNTYELHVYEGLDHMVRCEEKWEITRKWLKKYLS
jgi:dipeptidyl aminopeptidase/acylaminoacyl peptidase